MIFITIWMWSFALLVASLMYTSYKNPGKMYLDVFILMVLVSAIPGVALMIFLQSIYARIFTYRTKEDRAALMKKTWEQVEEIHHALQMFRGKF